MPESQAIEEFLGQKEIAVVGASRSPAKYGFIVYKKLKSAGYKVYAINPKTSSIDGDPCYPELRSLPESVKAAVVITPPEITEKIAAQAVRAGFKYVWLQPGAESEAAIDVLQANGIAVIYSTCLLVRIAD
ncbi:MAG: CoA-binding protein [Candidatus Aminicenantes bacterium]|nr:CoA-binding protein [Candidatus Aminicenantes bacterium]